MRREDANLSATAWSNPCTDDRLGAALGLTRRGFLVFPVWWASDGRCACESGLQCDKPGKHPIPKTGFKEATTNETLIHAWWSNQPGANIAIATGERSGVWVLDVDQHGDDGEATLRALEREHGALPLTLTSKTGGGGRHFFFKFDPSAPVRNRQSKALKLAGIDVRGEGGYAIAPPSTHASGAAYVWENPIAAVEPAPIWLLALVNGNVVHLSPPKKPNKPRGIFSQINTAALARISDWAPQMFPTGKFSPNGAFRVSSRSLGRDLEEDLSIHPNGVTDFGEERGLTPIDVVAKFGGMETPRAIAWLCEQLGIDAEFALTDVGNGKRLASRHGDDMRYCYPWRSWIIWDGKRYRTDDSGEAIRRAKDSVAAIYDEAAQVLTRDSEQAKMIAKWAMVSQQKPRLDAMIFMAQSELHATPDEFDRDDLLLNLDNGTLDLRTLTLREHRRDDRITKLAPIALDPTAACPKWLRFLERIYGGDQDLIEFVQRAAGYSLTGETGEQVLFLLHGSGANGKSTLLETFLAMMGDYARPTEFRTLLARENSEAVRNDLAALFGLRLVTAVEVGRGKRLDEAMVKQLTGGDTITARKLYQEYFDFRPRHKLWLAANVKPEIRGADEAIWRRVLLVPHEVTIPPEERDRTLTSKLRDELPGILNWAIDGLRAWKGKGLKPPERVRAATAEYREEMDILGDYIAVRCLVKDGAHCPTGALYADYEYWCQDNGEDAVKKRTFSILLKERGFGDDMRTIAGRKQRVKVGLALLDQREEMF